VEITPFTVAALPKIIFGAGSLQQLPQLIREYGQTALLVTGAHSLKNSPHWPALEQNLTANKIQWHTVEIAGEPSPQQIDAAVSQHQNHNIEVVIGIGGGSVMDAAKAIAGLLPFGNSVLDHLEGVGAGIDYLGPALPFIAVPTTAGTGSEATKNAVLSQHGAAAYKKSFRHDSLVAKVALLDPDFLRSCPQELIAANAMDALTQLIESYVSTGASAFTDALALDGIIAVRDGLFDAWQGGESPAAQQGRGALMYAALLSGITLAQAGLGSVHGLASPLGAFFPIPHGVVCGTLLAVATQINIEAMQARDQHNIALQKYADIARLLAPDDTLTSNQQAHHSLLNTLALWVEKLNMPTLSHYGVTEADIPRIVANSRGSSMLSNPIVLQDLEIADLVRQRL